MSDFDNTNSGALFKNKDKTEQTPTFADYNGSVNVEGREFWLNAWLKTAKSGQKYMSLSLKPKEAVSGQSQGYPQGQPQPAPDPFDDSEIPF